VLITEKIEFLKLVLVLKNQEAYSGMHNQLNKNQYKGYTRRNITYGNVCSGSLYYGPFTIDHVQETLPDLYVGDIRFDLR
jgi:hypothetical protein